MKPRISMIALGVENLRRATVFYEQGLSLPKIDSPPTVAFFALDGTWLGLSERQNLARDAGVSPDGSGYSGINLVHNVGTDEDVDALMESVVKAGGQIIKPPSRADWGGYHCYFGDLDGHLWEVAHNPFVWIGPEDK